MYAFDLIELNGDDLRREQLERRKAALARLLARAGHGVHLNGHLEAEGPLVFEHACRMGLEGIVSKRKASWYQSGRSRDWVKAKNPRAPAVTRLAEEDWGRSWSSSPGVGARDQARRLSPDRSAHGRSRAALSAAQDARERPTLGAAAGLPKKPEPRSSRRPGELSKLIGAKRAAANITAAQKAGFDCASRSKTLPDDQSSNSWPPPPQHPICRRCASAQTLSFDQGESHRQKSIATD
jgi:hypothetical protein